MTPEEKSLFKQALLDELNKEGINTVEELADKSLPTEPPSIQLEGNQFQPSDNLIIRSFFRRPLVV